MFRLKLESKCGIMKFGIGRKFLMTAFPIQVGGHAVIKGNRKLVTISLLMQPFQTTVSIARIGVHNGSSLLATAHVVPRGFGELCCGFCTFF